MTKDKSQRSQGNFGSVIWILDLGSWVLVFGI